MKEGDIIAITTMENFTTAPLPIYGLCVDDAGGVRMLVGWYKSSLTSIGKHPGDTFFLSGSPNKDLNWCVVPPDLVPAEVWAALALYQLTGELR